MKSSREMTVHFVFLILSFIITVVLLYWGDIFLTKIWQFKLLCFFLPGTVLLCFITALSAMSLMRHRTGEIVVSDDFINLQAIANLPEEFIKNNPEKIAEVLLKF